MITDKLKLNESKTEFMIIGTRQHLSKINRNTLLVDSDRVESVTEARNLGVLFDCNFNFCNLITKTSGLAFYSLHDIRRIRQYLTQDATKTLVQALVISRLDYSNSLLYGLPNIHINKLQRVENAAARLVSNVSRFSHISPVLYQLHWLPVKYRMMFKIILITFKALEGNAPFYICDLVQLRKQSSYNLR